MDLTATKSVSGQLGDVRLRQQGADHICIAIWPLSGRCGHPPVLFSLDSRSADDLRPFFGVIRDEFAEFRGRAWKHFRAQILKLGFELGIGKPRIDLAIELVDNVCRRIFWTPIPCQPKP